MLATRWKSTKTYRGLAKYEHHDSSDDEKNADDELQFNE